MIQTIDFINHVQDKNIKYAIQKTPARASTFMSNHQP